MQLLERDKKKRRSKKLSSRSSPAHHQVAGEVEVTTTIRTKGNAVNARPTSAPFTVGGSKAQASLNLLKDLKKIQTTLRKDDISWDE